MISIESGGFAQNEPQLGERPRPWLDAYLETLALYRQIAEGMLSHGVLLVHGSAISVDGAGYLSAVPSGGGRVAHNGGRE